MIKRLTALFLCICLLAGCAAGGTTPVATVPPMATPTPQSLTLYCGSVGMTDTAAARAVQLYAEANNVALQYTMEPSEADLAVVYGAPDTEQMRDLSAMPLLAAAAARAGMDGAQPFYALPAGRSLYAYWADGKLLTALLGENAAADLQSASWEEWRAFIAAFTAWLAEPVPAEVELSGSTHTLPEGKPAGTESLVGALYAPDVYLPASAARLMTPALLAAGSEYTADTLTGPLNGTFAALQLEAENAGTANNDTEDAFTAGAVQGLAEGKTLFVRLNLADVVTNTDAEFCADFVPVPVKCALDETDLTTTEYNLTGLMNYPTLASAGGWAIPAAAAEDGAKAAEAALLWLYTSAAGETALTDTLALVTPWGTASDASAVGAMQVQWVSTGILPEVTLTGAQSSALQQLDALERDTEDWKAARTQWVAGVLEVLTPAE